MHKFLDKRGIKESTADFATKAAQAAIADAKIDPMEVSLFIIVELLH